MVDAYETCKALRTTRKNNNNSHHQPMIRLIEQCTKDPQALHTCQAIHMARLCVSNCVSGPRFTGARQVKDVGIASSCQICHLICVKSETDWQKEGPSGSPNMPPFPIVRATFKSFGRAAKALHRAGAYCSDPVALLKYKVISISCTRQLVHPLASGMPRTHRGTWSASQVNYHQGLGFLKLHPKR
jgi:hypothetical protein